MKTKSDIPIEQVLLEIRMSNGTPFEISFVRSTGVGEGTIKKVKAIYGIKSNKESKKSQQNLSRTKHKYRSTIPLVDAETGVPLTPLIPNIIEFNEKIVKH